MLEQAEESLLVLTLRQKAKHEIVIRLGRH